MDVGNQCDIMSCLFWTWTFSVTSCPVSSGHGHSSMWHAKSLNVLIWNLHCCRVVSSSKQVSKQPNIHMHMHSAVPLVWACPMKSFRLRLICHQMLFTINYLVYSVDYMQLSHFTITTPCPWALPLESGHQKSIIKQLGGQPLLR